MNFLLIDKNASSSSRCFLPKIERKLGEDEFFLDWQKCLFKFLMFSPKNREKIKWRWKFFLIDKNTSSSCLFFLAGQGRWGNVASSFYFIFLSLGGPSFFLFYFILFFYFFLSFFFLLLLLLLLLGSNVKVASLFSFSFFFSFWFSRAWAWLLVFFLLGVIFLGYYFYLFLINLGDCFIFCGYLSLFLF